MKTLRFIGVALLAVLLSVSFSACGSDDDGPQTSSSPLIGTWEKTNGNGDYYILEFKADGSFLEVEYEGTTEVIKRSYKGSYKILSVNGNTYEVTAFVKEIYKKNKGSETLNESYTVFITLSDNNNTMKSSVSSDLYKRKK